MRYVFDLEAERRHVVEEARVYRVVGVSASLRVIGGRMVEEASNGTHGLQEDRNAELTE